MNRLAGETSPYLLQHAGNPVDWYPWGQEALRRRAARGSADLPVDRLRRVPLVPRHGARVVRGRGDGGVPERDFVPIKVDREERPDLDAIYMDAVQAMTGQGGWPLSVFLTPDGQPFFAGTYFPKRRSTAHHRSGRSSRRSRRLGATAGTTSSGKAAGR